METNFLVVSIILFFLRFGLSSSNTAMIASSSDVTCIESERQSLLAIKQSLRDTYNLLSTWRGVECCEWHGVGCDSRHGHIVKLDLRTPVPLNGSIFYYDKLLGGKLSPWLQNLKHLRYLDLSMNNFSGKIPEFLGSFERLEYLNLSHSGFNGVVPHHLGNLSRLRYLDLKNYFLIENIDGFPHTTFDSLKFSKAPIIDDLGWVSSLSSLRHLDLSGITIGKYSDWFNPVNMLPSLLKLNLVWCDIDLPSVNFVNFTSLNSLDLSLNYINSTIPMWLSNLTNLVHLNLNTNYFHGKIPEFLGKYTALVSIDLSLNSFDISMPNVLCNLSSLVHLDLSSNNFSGPVPANIGLLSSLEGLYLQYNQLSGNIPTSLWQLSKLKDLHLSYNSLVGVLSETHFTKLTKLKQFTVSYNSLALNFSSQWIPPFQLQMFYARSCNIGPRFPDWLQTQKNLQMLDLFNSSIRDTIPQWFEDILSHIQDLDLSNNQIDGKLPRFHGNSSNRIGVRILNMNSNKFEGTLATFPPNLKIFDLSDNLLSGDLPQIDGTMNPRLEVIDFSRNHFTGSIPVHLCEVSSVQVLVLSENMLSQTLPGCLGNLTNLNVIDVANNNITGHVPSSLGSLKNLWSLHLHSNKFKGGIPVSLQNLTNLVTMDLGNNLFMGNIPSWIGEKLPKLRILDLQKNKFTGKIPLQLCQLNVLQYLNLAHNNITWTIPRCFGNLSGMKIMTSKEYSVAYYEENILASMKGRQLQYTKTIKLLTSLDLSSNNIIGEVPSALMNLVGLKSLNLSRNLLQGQIPINIGDLKQLESLDLSLNILSGRIPQSLTRLNYLSYLNLSSNNLSGAIPVGNQIQTLDDPSIYEGNNKLCGPPLSRSCYPNDVPHNHISKDKSEDDTEGLWLWFYAGMGPGFVAGFMGLLGTLHFIKSWRVIYFKMLENVYSWLEMLILLNLARLRRKLFG